VKKVGLVVVALTATMYAGVVAAEGMAAATDEPSLTLPGGKLFLDAFVEVSLSKDMAFKPVSLAPDIWYGVSDDLTLGLVHSARGATGLWGSSGDGLCFTGKSRGCSKVYNNLGANARYHLFRKGGIALAADGGLYAMSLDPFMLSLKLGGLLRFGFGAFSIEFDPNIFIGITKRSDGNKEELTIPVTFMYALPMRLGIGAQLGAWIPFGDTDLYQFGGSLGVQYFATDKLILDAVFSLPALAGGSAVADGVDLRTFTLGVAYAF
jgi:hypothetical protein